MRRRMMMSHGERWDKNYLTVVALEDGLTVQQTVNAVEYCIDGSGEWISLPSATYTPAINTGHTISFRARLTPTTSGIGRFYISALCEVRGNIMSILFGDDAANQTSLEGYDYAFQNLFESNPNIVSAADLLLPATTLSANCYYQMFARCTSLHYPPKLPATTMAYGCYRSMFYYADLYVFPDLPATTLTTYCYAYMFYNNGNVKVPMQTLPASKLVYGCYYFMFSHCVALTRSPILPSLTNVDTDACDGLFNKCSSLAYITYLGHIAPGAGWTSSWVNAVASSGTFVKNKEATWNVTGVNGIPSGWTVVTE